MFRGYIDGKKWGLKTLIQHPDYAVHFTSKWQWVKRVAIVSLELSIICIAFIYAVFLFSSGKTNLLTVLAVGIIPGLFVSIALGIVSYVQSFVQYDKLDKKANAFLPMANIKVRLNGNIWVAHIHSIEFQLCYQEDVDTSPKITHKMLKRIFLTVTYAPLTDYPSPYNEDGGFTDDFMHDWEVFARDKAPSKYIGISPMFLYARFNSWDIPQNDISEVVEMMVYLLKHFHLQPLNMAQYNNILQETKSCETSSATLIPFDNHKY
ncbi:MAG: hypothetical protein K6E93_02815 [Bacteroidales bacterium]|nr:hypothetical protein [Bacteroidales bacterium]